MFTNFKKKLSNALQEGLVIGESLQQHVKQRISQTSSSMSTSVSAEHRHSLASGGSPSAARLNMAAGCRLLAKYEDDWKCIRDLNEENTATADQIAVSIETLGNTAEEHKVVITDLITCLNGVPSLVSKLQASQAKLKELERLTVVVEEELEKLEDLCEDCEFQEYMLQKQCELNRFKHKKMSELEVFRQQVALEHQNKIQQHEEQLRQIQRERQAVFDEAFRGDLEEYKQKGAIGKIRTDNSSKELVLEEVDLDVTDSSGALEEFLNG